MLSHFGAMAELARSSTMLDYTLNRSQRGLGNGEVRGVDYGANHHEEQIICCIPHCERRRADHVAIHLCERHIQKAWAAYQILNGANPPEQEDPERDIHSLEARGTVYIVRIGDLFKIGWTSKPKQRMKQLQPDAILHYRAGTRRDEVKLQAQCVDHLAKGREWFHANDEMITMIKELQVGKAA